MPQPLLANLFSHWHKPFGDFQTSSADFYRAVEFGVKRRQIPEVSISRIDWHEGGVFSAKRDCLRVTRQKIAFDLCAAPFGTEFFFSWWLGEKRPSRLLCWTLLVFFVGAVFFVRRLFIYSLYRYVPQTLYRHLPDLLVAWLIMIGIIVLVFHLYRLVTKVFDMDWDDPIIAVPIIGPLYERFFRPETYYRIDTMLMFQSAVQSAVCEAIDALTTAKGLRALTDEEKKPVMRDFLHQ